MTVRGRTKAPLYGSRHYSTYVMSRWLFDRTTAVSPEHARPFHLHVRLQRERFASNVQLILTSHTAYSGSPMT